MNGFGYKEYMNESLEKLREYFRRAAETGDPDTSFYQLTVPRRTYREIERLKGVPYVCLKVPTGGGKTVMACRAVAAAAQEYLRQERCLVLLLVPTETIKTQTLKALQNRNHPYRQVLEGELAGPVTALGMEEALSVQRSTLDGETVIIVSTLAAPRVSETEERRLYRENGSLMDHFTGIAPGLLAELQKYENSDRPIPSLANVLKLRAPVVIMDEAHNARTDLSFETLERFSPSCIVEFTATPAQPGRSTHPSNILHQLSAFQLKEAEMIKLPIRLETCPDWQQTLLSAINRRRELQNVADSEREESGEYLRPIVLVQAQRRNDELTVDRVHQALQDLGVPKHEIAVETGDRPELGDTDLFSPSCPIKFIITIDKLREGWDCSFAYILCSVRDLTSATAVEQILGRVLRMPGARRKRAEELNLAYAFVTSQRFAARIPAEVIAEALMENGFTREEAQAGIQAEGFEGSETWGGLFAPGRAPLHRRRAGRSSTFRNLLYNWTVSGRR